MDNSPYNSDSGSSAASGISAIARYSQSKRDRKTGRSPFERAVKNAVSAELSRLYPMPPMHLSSEYNKMANQRKTARPAIESRIRQEMMQQQQGREESPVSQGSFSHGSVPPSPMQIRSITPVPGTPMPVRMLQYNGTGETPQRHRMESLFERMASQVLANNSEQTNILAAALLQANDQARQDAQSKNVDALKCALDKNDEARKDTQNKNNEALQHALQHVTNKNKEALDRALHENNQARKDTQSMNDEALKTCTTANQHGIQELVSQHQERNNTALQQIFGAMPEFMADGNGFGNDDESPLVTHDNNADATEFVEQAGDVTKELFVENAGGGPAQETTTNPMIGSGNSGIAGDADISIADISIADTSIADTPIADIPIADTTIHNPDVSTSESAKKPAPKEDLTDLVRGRSSTKKRLHVGDSDAATPSIGKRQRVSNVRLSADKKTTPVSYQTPAVRSSSHRQAGLPPRAPKTSSAVKTHSVAKGLSSVKKAMNPSATMAPRRAPIWTVTRFFIASPGGTSYFLGDVSGWQDRVVQWSMSQYRLSFLLTDGTVAVFPFLKREGEAKACMGEINKSLIRSGKGWRVISVAARGPHTFTLERDAPDNQRRIKRQTGDDPTELLQIGGLKDGTLIDRLFPGDGYLVLIYQDNTLDLVRDDQVVDSWEEMVKSSLGEHYGKTIGDVFVGGLFVLAKLVVTGEIFCVPLYSDQEGPLKCDINKGLLALPRNWTGVAGVSCGYNHCVVHAVNKSNPIGRAYVAGSNSHFQLGHGGNSSGALKVVRALASRNVTAIFSSGNQSCAVDKEGRLIGFGDRWTSANSKDPIVIRDFNFQDLAIGATVAFAMVKDSNDYFHLVNTDSRVQVGGQIVDFHSMKTGGDHVGVKVFLEHEA